MGENTTRTDARPLGRTQRIAHVVGIAFGWLLFAWFWQQVAAQVVESRQLMWLLVGAAVAVPVLTLSWVLHNVGIYRRRGARKAVPAANKAYRVDYHGRWVVADWRMLAHAQEITIGIAGEMKIYLGTRPVEAATDPVGRRDDEIDSAFDTAAV